ncbi:MAG: hypothetical protein ACK5JM_08895, partial [Rhodoblastus sp.]
MASHDDGVPESFRDFATHLSEMPENSGLLFSGRALRLSEITKNLTFGLRNAAGGVQEVMLDAGQATTIVAFEIETWPGRVTIELIDGEGVAIASASRPLTVGVVTNISITAKGEDEASLEAWFDVSMHTLHGRMTKTLGEWLIGEDHLKAGEGDAEKLRTVLDPKVLTTLRDAQSR